MLQPLAVILNPLPLGSSGFRLFTLTCRKLQHSLPIFLAIIATSLHLGAKQLYIFAKQVLNLAFQSIDIRNLCLNDNIAVEELGEEVAKKLQNRVADLEAVSRASDLFIGNPRQVLYRDDPAMAMSFGNGYVIVFVSRHPKEVDWQDVFDIKIVKIGREHE